MNYLVLVPARAGSKGIRNKNIININNKPLILHTIEQILLAKKQISFAKIAVTTDFSEVKTIVKKYGLDIINRPKIISGDKAKSIDFVLHAIDYYKSKFNYIFDAILILQPTSPLRTADDIVQAIKIFNSSKYQSLISCYKEASLNTCYLKEKSLAVPLTDTHADGGPRQDKRIRDIYIRNGAIYLSKVNFICKYKKIISGKPYMYIMPKSRSLNLDTQEDLTLLRSIYDK